ncbi:unnamed protein product, partial [Strongylus vulgaris]
SLASVTFLFHILKHFRYSHLPLNNADDSRLTARDTQEVSGSEDNPPPQKRGLLARLSLRRKAKTAKASPNDNPEKSEKDKKAKRKKSQTHSSSPGSKVKADTVTGEAKTGSSRRRPSHFSVALEDKTKKWELVAVKGKASYLKNRSQRMFKDRMNKYRLVDSKGVVVEHIHDEEIASSHDHSASDGKGEADLPYLTSHIWGTGPEAIPRSQRSDPLSTHPNT